MLQVVQPQDFEKYFARGNSMFKLARIILLNGVSFRVLTPNFIMGMLLLSCAI